MSDKYFPDNDSLKIGNRVEYEKYQRLEQKLEELQDALHDLGEYDTVLCNGFY